MKDKVTQLFKNNINTIISHNDSNIRNAINGNPEFVLVHYVVLDEQSESLRFESVQATIIPEKTEWETWYKLGTVVFANINQYIDAITAAIVNRDYDGLVAIVSRANLSRFRSLAQPTVYTTQEIMDKFQCSRTTVWRMKKRGSLVPVKSGRYILNK